MIIEQYINSKSGNLDECEDGICVTDNFICLVDGATSKGNRLWYGNKKSGFVGKETVLKTVENFDKDISAEVAIKTLTENFKKLYGNEFEFFLTNPHERIEASILIYSKTKREIWSYGDCQVLVDGIKFSQEKLIDSINAETRALYNNMLLKSGYSLEQLQKNDLGRALITPLLEKQSLFSNENSVYGHAVINGINYNQKLIVKIPVNKGQEVILASDGYPFLKTTLKESEQELEKLIKSDPFLISTYKSTKGCMPGNISYDDRAYLRFLTK